MDLSRWRPRRRQKKPLLFSARRVLMVEKSMLKWPSLEMKRVREMILLPEVEEVEVEVEEAEAEVVVEAEVETEEEEAKEVEEVEEVEEAEEAEEAKVEKVEEEEEMETMQMDTVQKIEEAPGVDGNEDTDKEANLEVEREIMQDREDQELPADVLEEVDVVMVDLEGKIKTEHRLPQLFLLPIFPSLLMTVVFKISSRT